MLTTYITSELFGWSFMHIQLFMKSSQKIVLINCLFKESVDKVFILWVLKYSCSK